MVTINLACQYIDRFSKHRLTALLSCVMVNTTALLSSSEQNEAIDPLTIPKFVNELTIPYVFEPTSKQHPTTGHHTSKYKVTAKVFQQQILPVGLPKTTVLGYGGLAHPKDKQGNKHVTTVFSYPAPTFEVQTDKPIDVHWNLTVGGKTTSRVDPAINLKWIPGTASLHPTFPASFPLSQSPIPSIARNHGGNNSGNNDRSKEWLSVHQGIVGPSYSSLFHYPNSQSSATLFYHKPSQEMEKPFKANACLVGFYIVKDQHDVVAHQLPSDKYDIPLLIQDRSFHQDGSLVRIPVDAIEHNGPKAYGNTIVVNGKVWPNLNVEKKQYRFRILNGSAARIYNIKISDGNNVIPFTQIGGGDSGEYLAQPVQRRHVRIAPADYADIVVDFSSFKAKVKLHVINDESTPHQSYNPDTTGQIMQFTVVKT